jgi:hypothetical protein
LFGGFVDQKELLIVVGHGLGGVGDDEHEDGGFEGDEGDGDAFGLGRVYGRLHT